jgi:hypothetical protein
MLVAGFGAALGARLAIGTFEDVVEVGPRMLQRTGLFEAAMPALLHRE